jgi:hypothetical protein
MTQEIIVTVIGIAVVAIIIRKAYRIYKGKDNACNCCNGGCHGHCQQKENCVSKK